MADRIQTRRDVAANWVVANPILAQGEEGYEIDTRKLKFGDGATAWNALPYFGGIPGTIVTTTTAAVYNEANTSGLIVILCDTSINSITVNIPTAVGNTARFTVKKTTADVNTVTIDPSGAQTIDGGATAVLAVLDESIDFVSDNSNYKII